MEELLKTIAKMIAEIQRQINVLRNFILPPKTPEYIILHHTGGTDANPLTDTSHHTFEIVNEWHRQKWNFPSQLSKSGEMAKIINHPHSYIGYQYLITKDGTIHRGRLDTEEGAHTIGQNKNSVGIALAGNFDRPLTWPNNKPTKEQIDSLRVLLTNLVVKYQIPIKKILPHRNFAKYKSCFGNNLPDTFGQDILA